MPSPTGDLLDELAANCKTDMRPWGRMFWLNAKDHNLTVKYLEVKRGHRTSLQYHERKDELLIILEGAGYVLVGEETWRGAGLVLRIAPCEQHQVTGPLSYLEISTHDDDTDTIRISDDYGRT